MVGLVLAPQANARDIALKVKPVKRVMRASWYGKSFNGKRTASGSRFNASRLTAAHRTLHLGTKVKVTEMRSGRSVVVEITDRGPYLPGRDIDLSYAAAQALGMVRSGVARVTVELLDKKPTTPPAPVVTAFSWPARSWLPRAVLE